MIQQPELGRKIADYRKSKGFTQEELVEKCNLSVRTLQRIEAGEVTPRLYTIKLILEVLELNYEDSMSSQKWNNKGIINKWLEPFYNRFIDLSNLKTNTMRKITLLSLLLFVLIFGIIIFTNNLKAKNKKEEISECFDNSDNQEEFNGTDVNCSFNGVIFKTPILIIDRKNNGFNTKSAMGFLFRDRVEILSLKANPKKNADNIDEYEDKLILKGNAKLIFSDTEIIEADEIIILEDKYRFK